MYEMVVNGSTIFVKLEKFNSAGSLKDRTVYGILRNMIDKNELKDGDVLIEATSGNTGIALA